VKTEYASNLDLGDIVEIRVPRFDLNNGKLFVVIGMNENYRDGKTTLDLFG